MLSSSPFFITTHNAFVFVDSTSSILIIIHTNVFSPSVTVQTNG